MARIKEFKEINLVDLDISEIGYSRPSERHSMSDFDDLTNSIRTVGLLEPIIVCAAEESSRYKIIIGRFRVTTYAVREVRKGTRDGVGLIEFGDRVYSGAFLLETMPNVLYILSKFGTDPERAILEAVNHTKDNDTIAAIVGAAVGALHGELAFPSKWRSQLSGRLSGGDDGRVFELLDAASETWLGAN